MRQRFLVASGLIVALLVSFGIAGPARMALAVPSGGFSAGTGVVRAMASDGTSLYAGCDDGHVYRYDGEIWTDVGNTGGERVISLAWNGTSLYAGCVNGRVYRYGGGITWTVTGDFGTHVNSIFWNGTNLYAGVFGGNVFRYDGGTTWSSIGNIGALYVWTLAWDGANLFAGGNSGIVSRYDGGTTWTGVGNTGGSDLNSLLWNGSNLYAGCSDSHVYHYDGGTTWSDIGSTGDGAIYALAWDGTSLFASGADSHVYRNVGGSTWVDTGVTGSGYVQCLLPTNTAWLYAGVADGHVYRFRGGDWVDTFGPTTPALAAWYLAEGSTAWGFSTYTAIENPNTTSAVVRIMYMDTAAGNAGKGVIKSRDIYLPASSQTVVNAADDLGFATDFSTRVMSLQGKPLAVDRTMTFPCSTADESAFGAHNSIGASAPANTWYLPEGSGAWGFSTWTCVLNPNPADASVRLTYMTEAGPASFNKAVPANSRATFGMTEDIGAQDASIQVTSDVPVVAERTMYEGGEGGLSREAHCSVGATAPATDFFLAEGTTAWGFETYVLVQNPNPSEATVSLTYMTPDGPIAQPDFKLPAKSRKTIRANDELPYQTDISTMVHSDKPIVAERAMYWGVSGMLGKGMTGSIGVDSPHMSWFLPSGGDTGGRSAETFTTVQNPNPGAVTVQVNYMIPSGEGNVSFKDEIPANSRKTYQMSDRIKGPASIMVVSQDGARPVIVERSMYFRGRISGTATMGGFQAPNTI